MKRLNVMIVGALAAVLLAGCGTANNSSSEAPIVAPTITGVTVTADATSLPVGGNLTLTATVTGTGTFRKGVTWSTSAERIATVSSTGVVTGVAAGEVVITATSAIDTTKYGTITLTVVEGGSSSESSGESHGGGESTGGESTGGESHGSESSEEGKTVVKYSKNGGAEVALEENTEALTEEYMLQGLALEVGDTLSFSYGDLTLGYAQLKDESANLSSVEADGNGKIKAKVAGNYEFYIGVADLSAENLYKCIYMSAPAGEGGESSSSSEGGETETVVKYSKNGGAAVDLSKNEGAMTEEYMVTGLALEVGDVLSFSYGELALGYAQLKDESANLSSVEADASGNIKVKVAGSYDFYVGVADLSAENLYKCIYMNAPAGEGGGSSSSSSEGGESTTDPYGPAGSTQVSWYLVGKGSLWEADWDIAHSVQLWSNPKSETDKGCILNITVKAGDLFKVTNGTDWYGYDMVNTWDDPSNLGLHNFEGADDGYGGKNFKCNVTAVYDMYVNGEGQFWIQAHA